ncbi:amidase signature enzyme [Umbelopsis sp. AD052]|nr:amidase signature enzyme [Umbelopsis sp. AD052]
MQRLWSAFLLALVCLASLSLAAPTTSSSPFPMAKCNGFQLEEASIDQIQQQLASGRLTSRQLVQCYLNRISTVNPYLHAVIETNPEALAIADQLDKERAQGKVRGPLHGIPILVKDNIATADKLNTTAGSYALLGNVVPRDAHVIALLRKAGAIILGKGNMSEWADIRANSYSEGWSGRGGQTRNSYNLTQDPAGSSSGPAHAVSANLVTIAIGTETDGSVIAPAQRAGIIGIKPTVGLTSRDGVIPEAHSQDTVGAFGKTFKDAAYVLTAMHGVDPRDNATYAQQGQASTDYSKFVSNSSALKGVRIGIPWKRVWESSTTVNQYPQLFSAIDQLRKAGAIIVNNTDLPDIDEITPNPPGWNWQFKNGLGLDNQSEFTVVCYEFKQNLNTYLSELVSSPVRTLSDIVKFNDAHKSIEEQYFGQEAYVDNSTRAAGIDAALKNYKVQALLVPSDNFSPSTEIPAMAGYPMVTIPAGIDAWGVAFGLGLWGTAFSEPTLIKLGSAIDDTLRRRKVPTFLEHTATNIPINYEIGAY